MNITESNKELMKAFIRVLRDAGVAQTTSEMMCSMLKSKAEMDEVVTFIENNPTVMESDIMNKAIEVSEKN